MTVPTLTQEFEAIDSYLSAVGEVLRDGHIPDMLNLKDRIAQFCANALKATPDERKDYLAKLDILLTKLNACEELIVASQTSLIQNGKK